MRLAGCTRAVTLWASLVFATFSNTGHAHIDTVRLSLAQLFLQADAVALARIVAVSDRDFGDAGRQALLEVVTATVVEQFKGEDTAQVDFFLDAHGPAHYRAGDTVVLFLETPDPHHPLARHLNSGKLDYLSHQVRNTEHVVDEASLSDYRWVLGKYSDVLANGKPAGVPSSVEAILMRMLSSASPALVESALIDWQNAGAGFHFDKRDVQHLVAMTREDVRPINLRLSILRMLASRQLVGPEAWDALFTQTAEADLVPVVRSTRGFESRHFAPALLALLESSSEPLAEAATRALGHPIYTGSEAAVGTLLESDSQRLNYAAVAALVGMKSEQSLAILQKAARNHPNEKVRRLIDAKLGVAGAWG